MRLRGNLLFSEFIWNFRYEIKQKTNDKCVVASTCVLYVKQQNRISSLVVLQEMMVLCSILFRLFLFCCYFLFVCLFVFSVSSQEWNYQTWTLIFNHVLHVLHVVINRKVLFCPKCQLRPFCIHLTQSSVKLCSSSFMNSISCIVILFLLLHFIVVL